MGLGYGRLAVWCLFPVLGLTAMSWTAASGAEAAQLEGSPGPASVALVIGNGDNPGGPLAHPVNDARAMAGALSASGFRVLLRENLDRRAMDHAIREFRAALASGATGLFYYAGHGAVADDRQVLVPVDVDPASPQDLRGGALAVSALLRVLTAGRPGDPLIVVLDACRGDRFGPAGEPPAADPPGLDLPYGVLLGQAAAAGGAAGDGDDGLGLYTGEILRALAVPGLSFRQVLARAGRAVEGLTGGGQVPQTVGALDRALGPVDPGGRLAAALPPLERRARVDLAAMATRGVKSSREAQAMEMAFWEAIKDSENPADYEAYLESFPNGVFAPLARARLRQYGKKVEPAPPQDTEPEPTEPVAAPEPEPPQSAEPVPPTVQAVEGRFVAVENANVRGLPSPDAPKVAVVQAGEAVAVVGRVVDRDWYQIKTADGRLGFVYGPLLGSAPQQPSEAESPEPAAPSGGPAAAKPGNVFRDCATCPEMIALSSGTFVMGTNGGNVAEAPARRVSIQAFAIGRYEVTVAEWMACVAAGGCRYKPKAVDEPERMAVRNVSWNDTQQYLRWLSKLTGRAYRLPSEAEWEYAARGGSERSFWWGDEPIAKMAGCKDCGGPWSRKAPRQIGSFPPNAFGLYDVSGGVAEWTADCWVANYRDAPADGRARTAANCRQHVLRGGAWRHTASYLRPASRLPYDTDVRYLAHGFRVAAPVN